ncbi:MAG: ligand-binding sensor domain-containing protein [Vicinamibacteraceae bacterium]
MPRRCLHTWPTAAVCLGLLALSFPARAERLPIRSYTTSDGSPDNTINRIVRDSRGFLWFCTAEGLSQFDGYRFINYGTADGLPHPNVTDLLETREGDYWIATSSGLARFNPRGLPSSDDAAAAPRDSMFTMLTRQVASQRARTLTTLLRARDGTVWAGSWDGLLQLRRTTGGAELVPVDLRVSDTRPTIVWALLEDRFGTLWIGAENGLYRRWRNGRVARYGTRTGLPDDFVHDLLEDHQGRLWVATRMGGFFTLATEAGPHAPTVTRSYRRANGFNDWVFDLYQTSAERLFAATNHGLFEFPSTRDTAMATPRPHTMRNGLIIYHEINTVMEDGDDNLWLGTINGAMKIVGGGVRTFDVRDGVHLVNSLLGSAAGDLYAFGYVAGARSQREVERGTTSTDVEKYAPRIGRFDGQRFRWLLPDLRGADPSWSPRPFVLQARTGEWWIGSSGGLFRFPRVRSFPELARARPLAVYTTQHGLAASTVYTIYEDARGDVWISTVAKPNGVNGLARWDGATRSVRDLAHTPGLPSLRDFLPVSFREDRAGHLWVGFSPGGLGRYTRGRFSRQAPSAAWWGLT